VTGNGVVIAGLDPAIHLVAKTMDTQVAPTYDESSLGTLERKTAV
jgi:hypothetical protein